MKKIAIYHQIFQERDSMIYLDNAATTKPSPSLAALFERHITNEWFNPSAMYPPAVSAERDLRQARDFLCGILRADGALFNSCGTEGANTVIFKGWRKQGGKKLHFITTAYEHPCVYEAFAELKKEGHRVDFLNPGPDGSIHPEQLAPLICPETALVSIMHVNNVTGAINDIAALSAAVKQKNPGAVFHSDGVQGFLKVPFDMAASQVDYYTASAHKIHGLKGTGALFYRKGAPLKAYLMGGGQEGALRSGTENTFGILAFAQAAREYLDGHAQKIAHMRALQAQLRQSLMQIPGTVCITPERCAPHILNLAFPGMRGEVLLHLLEQKEIYVATGSACSSKKIGYSRIHKALGIPKDVSQCALRLSLCPENTAQEMEQTAAAIREILAKYQGFVRR